MAKFIKPQTLSKVWSKSGDNTAPSDAKINLGWVSEVPPRQTFNYLDNKQDQALAAFNQSGIPEWDATTEYIGGYSHTLGSDGLVYKAKVTNTNFDPVTDTANVNWELAFAPAGGPIALNGKITLPSGSAADPQYSFKAQPDTGLYLHEASGALVITVAGNEKARFSQSSITLGQPVTLSAVSNGVTPTSGDVSTKLATTAFVEDAILNAGSIVVGVGSVAMFAMSTLPTGYLKCNGQAVSRTVYADLFAKIGVLYGVGDGITTFNVPDYRGEFLRGWDDGRGVDAGRSLGSTQGESLKSHSHTATTEANGSHEHDFKDGYHAENSLFTGSGPNTIPNTNVDKLGSGSGDRDNDRIMALDSTTETSGAHSHNVTVQATGGIETRPRNVAVLFAIKF